MELLPDAALELEERSKTGLDLMRHRARMVGVMAGAAGLRNTARLIYGRLRGNAQGEDTPIQLKNRQFKFPIHATLNGSDIANFNEIAVQRVYDLPEVFDDEINGKPIVDIGAYAGIASAYFASRYPHSTILSMEPHPRSYALLQKNAEPYTNITPVQAAIAPRDGTAHMTIHGDFEEQYMSNRFSADGNDGYSVPAVSPQTLLEKLGVPDEIGLLKVDIEGAERELFASSAIDELLDRTGIVFIETHDQFVPGSHEAVLAATARHGMTATQPHSHTVMYSRTVC